MRDMHAITRSLLAAVVTLAALGVGSPRHAAHAQQPAGTRTAIVGGTLIDGNGGAPIADAVVLIDGARITAAGPRSGVPIPSDAKQIDARGRWIVPGLID